MNEAEIRKIVQNTINSVKSDPSQMTLALAEQICEAVLNEAKRIGVKAVVCLSDAGGHPKLVKAMDDAYIASYDVAVNKAFTVVALKMSTIDLKPLAQPGGSLYGIQFTNGGRIVIFGGGDPLIGSDGTIIGGIGVSGGSEAQDTALSEFGKRYFESQL
ncbi:MAG: heme-binding protein [Ruminococcaceae bacterium]|nr:heme-binding protein [Oscillospiraceae bacterium]